ncbi:MAG: Rieske (2Fe-2S) protein, partial [Rhodoferax sp.]|nr:Rieske (2Fe-2S) protein [Rhodoferax sp.]
LIDAANSEAFQRISGVTDPITQRHMRNAYYLPFSRRLDIEYPGMDGQPGRRHVIINCVTPINDGHIQLCQWLFRNHTEADCPAQPLIDFDAAITREDKEILESTDPDAVIDMRRRGVEYSIKLHRPGILIRKHLTELLARHGEAEVFVAHKK